MSKRSAGLVWWQWVVVIVWASAKMVSPPYAVGEAAFAGELVGSLVGAYIIVWVASKASRIVRKRGDSE